MRSWPHKLAESVWFCRHAYSVSSVGFPAHCPHSQENAADELADADLVINTWAFKGSSALHLAAFQGDEAIVVALLDCGATIDVKDKVRELLALRMMWGGRPFCRLCLECPFFFNAVKSGKRRVPHAILHLLPVSRGLNVDDILPQAGRTALMAAAHEGRTEVVSLLIQRGAKLKAQDKVRTSPCLLKRANRGALLVLASAGPTKSSTASPERAPPLSLFRPPTNQSTTTPPINLQQPHRLASLPSTTPSRAAT